MFVSLDKNLAGHVDVQYQPFIPFGSEEYFLPMNVRINSNLYRNSLQTLQVRLFPDSTIEPLSQGLLESIESSGHLVEKNLSCSGGDVDVLAMIDGRLLAFECKNSLVPASSHELKTSLDYIEKAASQLTLFQKRISNVKFRDWLRKKTGWPIFTDAHVSTCIVSSNRMFAGIRINGHGAFRGSR